MTIDSAVYDRQNVTSLLPLSLSLSLSHSLYRALSMLPFIHTFPVHLHRFNLHCHFPSSSYLLLLSLSPSLSFHFPPTRLSLPIYSLFSPLDERVNAYAHLYTLLSTLYSLSLSLSLSLFYRLSIGTRCTSRVLRSRAVENEVFGRLPMPVSVKYRDPVARSVSFRATRSARFTPREMEFRVPRLGDIHPREISGWNAAGIPCARNLLLSGKKKKNIYRLLFRSFFFFSLIIINFSVTSNR